ncbi:TolC family type I secretion outer membrane protein [Bartonella bacilliformis INS]|uniref:TolC family type I secretion outer membrane protein n=1 Tax=Bartonella bacilliformis INS TaxID=1206782 RepID=A0ABN0IG89_BARBA|nr:TolC family protein [Bartonella bacilliformis]EKS44587.1 TolC family type I secretion outer membrane protein [Bartonella bacilliformis INS]
MLLTLGTFVSGSAYADTLENALAKAYVYNAKLNYERAATRIANDDVTIARAGFLPQIDGIGNYNRNNATGSYKNSGSIELRINQRLFDFVTQNVFLSAQVKMQAQRESFRNAEQNLFLDVIKAYANVYQTRRIAELRRENLFAQAQAARSFAVSEYSLARSEAKSAEAIYQQVVGDYPAKLESPSGAKELPESLDIGYQIAVVTHPAILYAKYLVDASSYNVKAKEGAMFPKLDLSASMSYNRAYGIPGGDSVSQSVGLSLSVPIFEGGRTSAQVRQSREQFEQARLQFDLAQSDVKQALASAWFQLEGTRASVVAYRESVRAAEIALKGRMQENRLGQATTLDVLKSRTELINAQISLVTAERNAIIASYTVQSSIGRLTASYLGLKATQDTH